MQIFTAGVWGLVLLALLAETGANANSTVSKDEKETMKQENEALRTRMITLQKENVQLKKRDKKEVVNQILKELEQESKREANEEADVKRMKGEIRKLKSENANLRQMRQNDEKPKNRKAGLPINIDCEKETIVTFSRNVAKSNAVFKKNFKNLESYKKGFQSNESFWLGLDRLHELTASGKWDLFVRFKWNKIGGSCESTVSKVDKLSDDKLVGTWGWATWPNFKVEGASTNYTWHYDAMSQSYNFRDCDVLHKNGRYGDHNNKPFSFNCNGGFWYAATYSFAPTATTPTFIDICKPTAQYYVGSEAAMAIIKVG